MVASIRATLLHQSLDNPELDSDIYQGIEILAKRSDFAVPLIEIANLEFSDLPLSESILKFAQQAIIQNYSRLILIPVFLSAGIHVLEDIPQELDQAKRVLGNTIELKLAEYVGSYPLMQDLIANKLSKFDSAGKVILAHGSRLRSGNVEVENLAKAVDAKNAFWIIKPNLLQIVKLLIAQGKTFIVIVPYFLFIGRITDIISSQVLEMQKEFPHIKFCLTKPLGESKELAFVIAAQIRKYI